ncbi:MAG: sialate O-acetylesterase, partial [Bacteroidota bacterium]|nr:sialate O-acetylesterase [Bacteroidota bacterium]
MKFHKAFSLFLFLLFSASSFGEIKLPRLISDGMVLQRDTKTKIWGWAAPAEKITLTFQNKTYHTVADQDGNWLISLPSQRAGGPYEMTISGSNKIILKNILFGDVWICSGQSN